MSVDKEVLQKSFDHAAKALARLGELIDSTTPEKDMLRDATIQRFEFCYELMWKLFRKLHIVRGIKPQSVRSAFECIAEAGTAGWLGSREVWQQMIEDRNFTSHEYSEVTADEVYARIRKDFYPEIQRAYAYIREKFYEGEPLANWQERKE